MKKIWMFFCAVAVLMLLVACSTADKEALDRENFYSELDYLMDHPDMAETESKYTEGEISFTAQLWGENYTPTFDGDTNEYTYQDAIISRNNNTYISVDMSDITNTFADGEYVVITGEITGSVTWTTEDDTPFEVLDVKASTVMLAAGRDVPISNANPMKINYGRGVGEYTFVDAAFQQVNDEPAIVLRFTYKNTEKTASAPAPSRFDFYQADLRVEQIDEVLTDAPEGYRYFNEQAHSMTAAGEETNYFIVLRAEPEAMSEDLCVCLTNDEFYITNEIYFPISE